MKDRLHDTWVTPRVVAWGMAMLTALVLGSAGPAAAQLVPSPRTLAAKQTALAAPQELVAIAGAGGVQLSWKGVEGAAFYLVLRGDTAAPVEPAIARLPAPAAGYLDKGFTAKATYQVIAVAADGRRGASALAVFMPAARAAAAAPRALLSAPVAKAPAAQTLVPTLDPQLPRTASALPLSIGAVHRSDLPQQFNSGYVDDTMVIEGTGLDAHVAVALLPANMFSTGEWVASSSNTATFSVAAFGATGTRLNFVIPELPIGKYLVRVSKGQAVRTSAIGIDVFPRRVPHKILSVAQDVVRAGGRFRVSGVGFDSGGVSVSGAYFGVGAPGTPSNPLFAIANRSDTGVDVMLPSGCDQQGILMLASPNASGSPTLVTGDQPIVVGCAPATPNGRVVGSEAAANGVLAAQPGATIAIRGTALRYVTRVVDTQNNALAFTFSAVGSGSAAFEQLSVTLPTVRGQVLGFRLENRLTDPVVPGTVTGSVYLPAAPTWLIVSPSWAEPGQKIRIAGRDLSLGRAPSVSVGGVAAQVLAFDPLWVEFRLGAGTGTGPIVLSTDAGTMTASGMPNAVGASPQPEFFVVSGPSVLQGMQASVMPLASGAVLTVTGQNLARLGGICLDSNGQVGKPAGYFALRRITAGGAPEMPAQATSNTVMRVAFNDLPATVRAGSAVQLYAPSTPPGDFPPTNFSCAPNGASLAWPF